MKDGDYMRYIMLKLQVMMTARKMKESRGIREEETRKEGQKYYIQIIDFIREVKAVSVKEKAQ